ncbi:MAG: hypothetical protein GY899_03730, partial [Verrucomicrobiaceae bacterium]|nr:hypothetical protein [Verrucomicrobiaceae bacterium]
MAFALEMAPWPKASTHREVIKGTDIAHIERGTLAEASDTMVRSRAASSLSISWRPSHLGWQLRHAMRRKWQGGPWSKASAHREGIQKNRLDLAHIERGTLAEA